MRLVATLTLMALSPLAAQAQSPIEAGLGHVPDAVLSESGPIHAWFSAIGPQADGGDAGAFRHYLGAGRALETLRSAPSAVWEEKAGLPLGALDYLLTYGNPPAETTIWGLTSEVAAGSALAALASRGFAPTEMGSLGNGEPGRIDPTRRDPADPWRGKVGQASFVHASGAALIQTEAPRPAGLDGQMSMADNPLVATALTGLAALEPGGIVQAVVISPLVGLASPDMADLLGKPLEEVRAQWAEEAKAEGAGMEPFLGGVIADMGTETPRLALSLTFADCASAAAAAETIAARWSETMRTPLLETTAAAVPGSEGLCAGLVTVDVEPADGNPAYRELLQMLMMNRGVPLLAVGTEE